MINNDHPAGRGFTSRWDVNYDDYRRAIAMQAHYANKCVEGIDALMVDAADHGRVRSLIVALLDMSEAVMPVLGHPDVVNRLNELAALWAGMHDEIERNNKND